MSRIIQFLGGQDRRYGAILLRFRDPVVLVLLDDLRQGAIGTFELAPRGHSDDP